MPTRLSLAVVATISLIVASPALASPITYAFTGTLAAPLNGSNQFSGSFTINGDPSVSGNPGSVIENGNDVSLALNIGGQKFNIVNQANAPAAVSFTAGLSPSWIMNPTGPQQDEALISAGMQSTNPLAKFNFGLSFYSPASSDQLDNLRDFSFPIASSSVFAIGTLGGSSFQTGGSITSIELVPTPTPEPSTLAIFAVLSVVAMTRRRRS